MILDQQDQLVHKEFRVKLEIQVQQDLLDLLVHKVSKVDKVILDQLVQQDLLDLKEFK